MRVLSFLLMAFISVSAAAQSMELSLQDCLELSREKNVSLEISRLQYETVLLEKNNAWNAFLPSMSISGSLNGSKTHTAGSDSSRSWSMGPEAAVSLTLNAGVAEEIKQKNLALEASALEIEDAEAQLDINVEKSFYYLLTLQNNLELLKSDQELARKRLVQAKSDFKNGYISELSKLQTQVSYANTIPDIALAESGYKNNLRTFANLLGLNAKTEITLAGTIEISDISLPEADNLVQQYMEKRFDIRELKNDLQTLYSKKTGTTAETLGPTLKIGTSWENSKNSTELDTLGDSRWTDQLTFSLSVTLPLNGYIPGSEENLNLKELSSNIKQTELSLKSTISNAEIEILNLAEEIQTGKKTIQLNELNLNLAKKAYEMEEDGYKEGTSELLDVEDAQQEVLSASQELLTSKYEYLAALLDLRYALGNGDLQGTPE